MARRARSWWMCKPGCIRTEHCGPICILQPLDPLKENPSHMLKPIGQITSFSAPSLLPGIPAQETKGRRSLCVRQYATVRMLWIPTTGYGNSYETFSRPPRRLSATFFSSGQRKIVQSRFWILVFIRIWVFIHSASPCHPWPSGRARGFRRKRRGKFPRAWRERPVVVLIASSSTRYKNLPSVSLRQTRSFHAAS
jgi:hypothetical protein